MVGLARQLFERRVPQVLAIYAGASWGMVEFVNFIVEDFLLSPHWTRVVMTVLLLLLPTVVMIAWFHGRQGRDEVPLAEKIGIPANLVVAVGVLVLLFGGSDLGAATTAVSVETEDGVTVERVVPKPEFRKRTALFPFDAGPGLGEDEAWLTYMTPTVLELDLAADDFFEPLSFNAFRQRLMELGFPALLDVPLALKREVAEELHAAFIAAGTVDRVEGRYRVTLSLYETGSGSAASETVHEGPDFLALVDEMSETLADALEIPDRDDIEDLYRLPERMRFGIKSDYYFMMQQPEKAWPVLKMWAELHPEDPAALRKYIGVQLLRGDWKEMVGTLGTLYRLSPSGHSLLRALAQAHEELGDIDRALEALEQYVERFPEDYSGYVDLVRIQRGRGDHDSARDYLERAIFLEPRLSELASELASLDGRVVWTRPKRSCGKRCASARPIHGRIWNCSWCWKHEVMATSGDAQD